MSNFVEHCFPGSPKSDESASVQAMHAFPPATQAWSVCWARALANLSSTRWLGSLVDKVSDLRLNQWWWVWYSYSLPNQETGWEEHLRNDLFCVGWDVKPQLSQSTRFLKHLFSCFGGSWSSASSGLAVNIICMPLYQSRHIWFGVDVFVYCIVIIVVVKLCIII